MFCRRSRRKGIHVVTLSQERLIHYLFSTDARYEFSNFFFLFAELFSPFSVGIFSAIQFKTFFEVDLALGSVRVGLDNFPRFTANRFIL